MLFNQVYTKLQLNKGLDFNKVLHALLVDTLSQGVMEDEILDMMMMIDRNIRAPLTLVNVYNSETNTPGTRIGPGDLVAATEH